MQQNEFDACTALEKVRQLRRSIDDIDMFVGREITEGSHNEMRSTARGWEQNMMQVISITAPRKRRKKGAKDA